MVTTASVVLEDGDVVIVVTERADIGDVRWVMPRKVVRRESLRRSSGADSVGEGARRRLRCGLMHNLIHKAVKWPHYHGNMCRERSKGHVFKTSLQTMRSGYVDPCCVCLV